MKVKKLFAVLVLGGTALGVACGGGMPSQKGNGLQSQDGGQTDAGTGAPKSW